MTDATVLADALVEAGILDELGWSRVALHDLDIVTDWRVAGKVLELCADSHLYWDDVDFGCELVTGIGLTQGKGSVDGYARLGLPRAIIEAWYEAQNNDLQA
jgi:hypothetical protein